MISHCSNDIGRACMEESLHVLIIYNYFKTDGIEWRITERKTNYICLNEIDTMGLTNHGTTGSC